MGKAFGEQHQFIDAAQVLQQVGVVCRGLAAYADALQRLGILEDVLTELRGRLRQDDGLKGCAVLEQVVAHEVILRDLLVDAITVIAVVIVLLQLGVPQVQVFQSSIRRVAVVGIGTCQVADDGEVLTIQRTADGQ